MIQQIANKQMLSSNIYKNLNDDNFGEVLSDGQNPMIIMFSASWSGNAVIVQTVMEKVHKQFKETVNFYDTDIDENPAVRKFFNVNSIPTIVFMQNGEILSVQRGLLSKKKIIQKLLEVFEGFDAQSA